MSRIEVSWFGALCDDDYEFLGVPEDRLKSSYPHCADIVLTADQLGYDNILLPSGYTLGIDTIAFASAIAPQVKRMQLLAAVRMGEMWVPQLARQLATIDQMLDGRLTINIISSDIPGEKLESEPRYKRTQEWMFVLRELLNGNSCQLPRGLPQPGARTGAYPHRVRHLPPVLLRRLLPSREGHRGPVRRRVPDLAGHRCRSQGNSRGHARARYVIRP